MRRGGSSRRISSAREVIPSFANTLRKWYSTVRGLRNSCPAMSLFEPPSATSRAIWSSCGVSSSTVLGSRLRTVSPVARNSPRARSAHGSAPSASKASTAARRWSLASSRRRSRRRCSPSRSWVRPRSNTRLLSEFSRSASANSRSASAPSASKLRQRAASASAQVGAPAERTPREWRTPSGRSRRGRCGHTPRRGPEWT